MAAGRVVFSTSHAIVLFDPDSGSAECVRLDGLSVTAIDKQPSEKEATTNQRTDLRMATATSRLRTFANPVAGTRERSSVTPETRPASRSWDAFHTRAAVACDSNQAEPLSRCASATSEHLNLVRTQATIMLGACRLDHFDRSANADRRRSWSWQRRRKQ